RGDREKTGHCQTQEQEGRSNAVRYLVSMLGCAVVSLRALDLHGDKLVKMGLRSSKELSRSSGHMRVQFVIFSLGQQCEPDLHPLLHVFRPLRDKGIGGRFLVWRKWQG